MTTLADLQVVGDQLASDLGEAVDTARALEIFSMIMGLSGGGVAVEAVDAGVVFSDPIAIAAGVAAIIIAVAFKWVVAEPIAWALGKIPFIGGTLSGWVNDVGDWEWNLVADWAHTAMEALWWVLQTVRTVVGLPWLAVNILLDTAYRVLWVQNTQVPNAEAAAVTYTQQWVAWLWAQIVTRYDDATSYAQALYNQATGYAYSLWQNAITFTTGWIAWVWLHAQLLQQQAIAYTDTQIGTVTQYVDTKVGNVEIDLGNLLTEAEQHADLAIGVATTAILATVGAEVSTLAGVAGGAANAINNFLDTCGDDICKADGQNAKNVNALGQLIATGALFAFLAACINDPVGTAEASADILTATEGPALGLVDTLVTAVA